MCLRIYCFQVCAHLVSVLLRDTINHACELTAGWHFYFALLALFVTITFEATSVTAILQEEVKELGNMAAQ